MVWLWENVGKKWELVVGYLRVNLFLTYSGIQVKQTMKHGHRHIYWHVGTDNNLRKWHNSM
jgi:hypothetical protein